MSAEQAKTLNVSFNVLELLNRERTTFGLRSSSGDKDFDRYRQHCTNKVHRLRQVTGLTCGDAKKGFKGVKKVEPGEVKDVKQLQLLLFLSERSYAHSQSLFSQLTKSKSKSSSSGSKSSEPVNNITVKALKKEHLSKLRKAVGCAEELDGLVAALEPAGVTISLQTRLEILTYLLHLRSLLGFHRAQYDASLPPSCLRHHILTLLSSPSNCTSSFAQAIYAEGLDEGDPLIRFSAYQLGRKETHDVDGIVKEFGAEEGAWDEVYEGFGALEKAYKEEVANRPASGTADGKGRKGARGTLQPIIWANQPVTIRNAGIVNAIVRAQTAIFALDAICPDPVKPIAKDADYISNAKRYQTNGKTMNRWDEVLAALGEAESIARRAAEENQDNAIGRRATKENARSSPTFVHQYISHLLLKYRIRRDLHLAASLGDPLRRTSASTLVLKPATTTVTKSKSRASAAPYASQPHGKQPLTRAKKAEAPKTLNALVKLYDSVLQGMGQIRELGIVEDGDEVRRASEGMEAYFKAVRCVKLAQMYLLLPTSNTSAAVHLASQATIYANESRSALGLFKTSEGDIAERAPLLELFHPISSPNDLVPLERQAEDLESVTKRALYTEVKGRPLFYDTAFDYIELPMEELELAAGKAPQSLSTAPIATAKGLVSAVTSAVSDPVHAMEGVVETAKKSAGATPVSRGRESTPGPEESTGGEASETKSKGWFGGLWGGKK